MSTKKRNLLYPYVLGCIFSKPKSLFVLVFNVCLRQQLFLLVKQKINMNIHLKNYWGCVIYLCLSNVYHFIILVDVSFNLSSYLHKTKHKKEN